MSKLKYHLTIPCISFTVCIFILAVMFSTVLPDGFSNDAIIELLVVHFTISLLMYFTDKLPVKNRLTAIIIDIFDIILVTFGLGGIVFDFFPMETGYMALVLGMILFIYFAVCVVYVYKDQKDAEKINEILNQGGNKKV